MVYLKNASHLMSSGNVKASPNKTVDIVLAHGQNRSKRNSGG